MPVVSEDIWRILYTVSRYLLPFLAVLTILLIFFFIISESRSMRESIRRLPGSGMVGELVVLSDSGDLASNTWFPVPREGVLGAVRSCDLVIPCPGVHAKHLDFSWQDGLGLLIHLRSGCEALVNGIPVTCRTDASTIPLTHGSVLQIGSAVLRLHLFAALDVPSVSMQPSVPYEMQAPVQIPAPLSCDRMDPPMSAGQDPSSGAVPFSAVSSVNVMQDRPSVSSEDQPEPRRTSSLWKEEIGE